MPIDNPIVLVTRPAGGAARFITALEAVCDRPFTPIVSPLFSFETISQLDEIAFDVAVFTSARAIKAAGEGSGRIAYCVGERTSARARELGYEVRNADGDSTALVALIKQEHPTGVLVHFRGEVSAGDVTGQLRDAGIACEERIVYRKVPRPLTAEARKALDGERPVLVPVFSPESADMLAVFAPFDAPVHVCALSAAVAEQAAKISPETLQISARPRLDEMVALVAAQIA